MHETLRPVGSALDRRSRSTGATRGGTLKARQGEDKELLLTTNDDTLAYEAEPMRGGAHPAATRTQTDPRHSRTPIHRPGEGAIAPPMLASLEAARGTRALAARRGCWPSVDGYDT